MVLPSGFADRWADNSVIGINWDKGYARQRDVVALWLAGKLLRTKGGIRLVVGRLGTVGGLLG